MEQLDYNFLYRWFVGLSPDDPVWDPTTFTKNRDRLQNGEVFTKFMSKLLNHPQVKPLLSDSIFQWTAKAETVLKLCWTVFIVTDESLYKKPPGSTRIFSPGCSVFWKTLP